MSQKVTSFFGLLIALAASIFATGARAAVIDFTLPPGVGTGVGHLGNKYSQDGYTFTNSTGSGADYINWVALGSPQFNADDTADIAQNFAFTTNTITNNLGQPFSFTSIGLASGFNDGTGGSIEFIFVDDKGKIKAETVTLDTGITGLQTFKFNEKNLTKVMFLAVTTERGLLQFDEVGVSPVVGQFDDPVVPQFDDPVVTPLPGAFPLFATGLAGLGLLGWRRKKTAAG